ARLLAAATFALDHFDAAVENGRNNVPVVQERVFLEADIDESSFKAVFKVLNLAFENAAYEAFVTRALNRELLELAVLQHRHPNFQGFRVNDDFLVNPYDRLDQALDFSNEPVRGGAD